MSHDVRIRIRTSEYICFVGSIAVFRPVWILSFEQVFVKFNISEFVARFELYLKVEQNKGQCMDTCVRFWAYLIRNSLNSYRSKIYFRNIHCRRKLTTYLIPNAFFPQVLDVNEQNGLYAHISNFAYPLTYNRGHAVA
jgi:hypothetical protein